MINLLFVCTANTCRSPMAAGLAGSMLASRAPEASVSSAGVMSGTRPAAELAVETMRRRGVDLTGHSSRRVNEALQPAPDLVLTMALEHSRVVVDLNPALFPRTFTLKEFVQRAEAAGPRNAGEDVDSYIRRVSVGRKISELAGFKTGYDVDDPIGGPRQGYERCADELSALIRSLVNHLWP